MYNPCFECLNRYGHSYTEECDGTCNYAYDVRMLKAYEKTELSPEEFKESVDFVLELNAKVHKVIKDLKYYLDTNEENGVVYIPKFVIEKMVDENLKTKF